MEPSYFQNLKQRIQAELGHEDPFQRGHSKMMSKFTLLVVSCVILYTLLLWLGPKSPWLVGLPLLLGLSGFCLVMAFSIMHAGSHSSFGKGDKTNWIAAFTLIPFGTSPTLWYHQHVVMHHSYTNIHELDKDLEAGGFIRCHPMQEHKSFQRYQHFYALFLYCFVALKWIVSDVFDLVNDVYKVPKRKFKKTMAEIIIAKIMHICLCIVLPYTFFQSWPLVIAGYFLFLFLTGFALGLIFQLAHVSNVQEFPASLKDKKDNWVLHQLATTADFAVNNRFLTWFCGALNFQVEHHVFPGMCELHYPKVQKIIKQFAAENGLPYYEHPTFWGAVKEHLAMLKKFGNPEESPHQIEEASITN